MSAEFQEDIVDILLRYGLFVGAIFQLICIGAVIVMPDPKSDSFNESDVSEEDQSDRDSPQVSPNHRQYRNLTRKDRKKRR